MRIGILGGSFDPPHVAHSLLADAVVKEMALDHLWVVPTRVSPFKIGKTETPAESRFQMCLAAFPNATVSDLEIHRSGPSFSIDTLFSLQSIQPGDYWWVGGSDLLAGLTQWHRIEDMVQHCRFAISYRPGYDPQKFLSDLPSWMCEYIDFFESEALFSPLSSTAIREGSADWDTSLSLEVRRYIESHRLYHYD